MGKDTHLIQTGAEVQDLLNKVGEIWDGRAVARHNTTAFWDAAVGYVPASGEIIVYEDYKTITRDGQTIYVPGVKIGSGNGYVQDLAFLDDAVASALLAHIGDTTVHITDAERTRWNGKLNMLDYVLNETLIFNRE